MVVRRAGGVGADGRARFRDVLGDLLEAGDEIVVATRAGVIRFARSEVASARLVTPAPAEQLALEAITARGWRPAEIQESVDGWLLRADRGWTGRANSALALRTPRRPLAEVSAAVIALYAERGLPARTQLPGPAMDSLDRGLDRLGWRRTGQVDVLVCRLDLLAERAGAGRSAVDRPASRGPASRGPASRGPAAEVPEAAEVVELAATAGADWLAAYHYRGGDLPASATALLHRHDRVSFATVRDAHGAVVAIARGALDDGWLGVTAVEIRADHRRRGLGRALVIGLGAWATDQGAERCYLQVSADNAAAGSLYRRLGFYRHHGYHYRDAPTGSGALPIMGR